MKKIFLLLTIVCASGYASSNYHKFLYNTHLMPIITKLFKGNFFTGFGSTDQNSNPAADPAGKPAESSSLSSSSPICVSSTADDIQLFRKGNFGFLFTQLQNDRNRLWEHIFKMIASGLSINTRDESGKTLLFYITKDDLPYISKLIKGGIDVHARDNYGRTAFDCFCDHLFSQSYYISEFEYVEEFINAGVMVNNKHAEKIFQKAILFHKVRLAEKIDHAYHISKEYKSALLFEFEEKNYFIKLLNFDVDILHKNSKGETVVDFYLRKHKFAHLEALVKQYSHKITDQQKTDMIQGALDKNNISFIKMMSKEHLNAFTQTQINQSVIKAVENYDYFNTNALIDCMGSRISKESAQKVFKELILRSSLTLAKKIDNSHNLSKEYKSSILFDVKEPKQLIVLLDCDVDFQYKNSKKETIIDIWLREKKSLFLEILFETPANKTVSFFVNPQVTTNTIQVALENNHISFLKTLYKNYLNEFTERQMNQFIELELEKKDIEFLQSLRKDHPNSFTESQNAELEKMIIEKKIADAERAARNRMIKYGVGAAIAIGFIYWLFNRNN